MREIVIENRSANGDSAVSIAVCGEERCFRLTFANKVDGKYDYENGIACDLGFEPISQVIQILGGTRKFTGNESPLYLDDGTVFAMKKESDGAMMAVSKGEERVKVKLTGSECEGLKVALWSAMYFITFAD